MKLEILAIFIVFSSLLSYWACGKMVKVLAKHNILDTPNHRSNHKSPTPTGGGIAILKSLFIGSIPVIMYSNYSISSMFLMMIVLLTLAIVSFLDDIKDLSVLLRLTTHIIAGSFGAFIALSKGSLFGGVIPYTIEFILLSIFITGFINLFNFMDGIDGMTAMESIYLSIAICVCFYLSGADWEYIYILILLCGSVFGFLIHNWHPAKLFIGDVGSISLGFVLGTFIAILATTGHKTEAIILPMYYFADAGIVVLIRMIKMEKFWLPHSKFFFQRAVRNGMTHSEVVLHILLTNLLLFAVSLISIYSNVFFLYYCWYIFIIISMLICYISIKKLLSFKKST